jgi:LuxR family maltose regulon positive regulatory protein
MKMTEQSPTASRGCIEDPILTLRFEVPRLPKQYVERRRLLNRLDEGGHRPLTLVSAPAGSGKTTLLAAWAAQRKAQDVVAWLTFEIGDDQPERFWSLVIESMSRRGLALPDDLSGSRYPHRRMLMELSVALAHSNRPLTLVLDGFEVTDARLARDVEFLLGHSGRRLRIVLLTRADPVMRLDRFRLQDTITELRMADLAFSDEETARLLEQSKVNLSSRSVSSLVDRTRGWAAGLRFAAMLLEHSEDPDETVAQLNGDSGNIAEYLMAEILQTQGAETRELLLRTSVVDVLQPGLVEELGGRGAGRAMASLARANVLIEELRDHPGWFRYHPFLRDLLRAELAYASPHLYRRLQLRAATWFASQGHLHEAVVMCAASGAWTDAARYTVEGLAIGQLVMGDGANDLVRVFRDMPRAIAGPSPYVVRAALALADSDPVLCAEELSRARDLVDDVNPRVARAVGLAIDVVDSVRACLADEVTSATSADDTARRLAAEAHHDSEAHKELAALLQTSKGVAQFRAGDIASAGETLSAAAQAAEGAGREPLLVSALAHSGLVACVQGRLREGEDRACRSIALAEAIGMSPSERFPEAEIALAWVSVERYDLRAAAEHLNASMTAIGADPIASGLSSLVRARLLRLGGGTQEAITLIDEARATLPGHVVWLADLLRIEAAEALIARGDAERAMRVVDGLQRPEAAAVSLLRGRAHLIRDDWEAVAASVADLVGPESTGAALPVVVGGCLLQVALELHHGRGSRARVALDRALHLAAPECLRSPFRGTPAPIRTMLEADPRLLAHNAWLGRAVTPRGTGDPGVPLQRVTGTSTLGSGAVLEPLTAKEKEVLGHLSELLTTQEIAATMFISVNTVRTHVASILRKLAVSRRNEAVRRARALSLIGSGRP